MNKESQVTDGCAKSPSLPPTLEAVNMKREQDRLQDKQIISLLDKRRLIDEAKKQNEADLLFVGYHPPVMAEVKRYTEEQWLDLLANEGLCPYLKTGIEETYKKLEKTESLLAWTQGLLAQVKEKNKTIFAELKTLRKVKPVKKRSSKKK